MFDVDVQDVERNALGRTEVLRTIHPETGLKVAYQKKETWFGLPQPNGFPVGTTSNTLAIKLNIYESLSSTYNLFRHSFMCYSQGRTQAPHQITSTQISNHQPTHKTEFFQIHCK